MKMATTVKSDKVSQKFDTADDVADIVADIRRNESTLETLNLQGNSYGIQASAAIGEALELCHNLRYLELDDMFISRLKDEIPECLNVIFRGVMNAGAKIHTLNLNDNAIGPVTMPALLPFLRSDSCAELEVLKLNNCGLGIKGGQMLAEVLGSKDHLRQIVIGRNRLEIDGIRAISRSLSEISSLEVLELPQNGTKHEGISALCEAIRANKNIRVLNVNDNVLRTTHREFASAVETLDNLEVLNLGDCLLKSAGARSILQALINIQERTGNTHFREILLNGNEISRNAVELIYKLGEVINYEIKIDLNSNCFGEEACNSLEEFFAGSSITVTLEDDEEDAGDDEDDDAGNGDEEEEQKPNEPEIVDVEKLCEQYSGIDTETLCEKFFTVTSNGLNGSKTLSEAAQANAEAIIRVLTKRDNILNTLLVSCGLIKGEDKTVKGRINANLSGTLLAVSKNIKNFQPSEQQLIRTFIEKKLKDQNKYECLRNDVMNNIYNF